MKVKSESEVAQSHLTLSDPMDCSLPGSSVHGIFQATVLEWVAVAFSGKTNMRQAKIQIVLNYESDKQQFQINLSFYWLYISYSSTLNTQMF